MLAATPAMAQMMGNPGQHMTQQQQQQYNPQMMDGYGMGPQMMGSCGMHMPFGGMSGPYFSSNEEFTKFLDNTKDLRRKMHALMFEFSEAARSTDPDKEKLQAIVKEMNELRTEIFNYKIK